jgi:hypothetical protein
VTKDIAELLRSTGVKRGTGGGATLTSEPVVVVRGQHLSHFDLFDRGGRQLGRVVRLARQEAYEFRDIDDRCLIKLEDVGSSWRSLGLTKWRYEVSEPDMGEAISARRIRRWKDTAWIGQGPVQVGTIGSGLAPVLRALGVRGRKKSRALVLQDLNGRQAARIHVAHTHGQFVDLVIEVQDETPEQLRRVAIAASVIADRELIDAGRFSSFGTPVSTGG